MTVPVVVDTNVVVAGLISRPAESPVCRMLDGMLTGRLAFLLSVDLLDEYRRVLLRPAIENLHGLSADQVDAILTVIAANAIIREPISSQALQAPDRGDDHLWELLAAVPGAMLVIGDRVLLEQPPDFASVISHRTFTESFDD